MNREQISQLTIKVYKLTILFPKKEPLRYRLRELAGNILANVTTWELLSTEHMEKADVLDGNQRKELVFNIQRDLEVVQSYLELAKWQNWVSYFDILKIMEEYAKLIEKSRELTARIEREDVSKRKLVKLSDLLERKEQAVEDIKERLEIGEEPKETAKRVKKQDLNERESKIIEVLREKGKVQVWEISKMFPDISKRTIRRDFVELLDSGLIKRIGEKNNTFYQL